MDSLLLKLFCLLSFLGCIHSFGPSSPSIGDGLLVSPSILDNSGLGGSSYSGGTTSFVNHRFVPQSNEFYPTLRQPTMFEHPFGNLGRSFVSPAQLYSTAMLAREFMFQPEWNSPFMFASPYMSPFNNFYPSNVPFMSSSAWFYSPSHSMPFSQQSWQTSRFNQYPPSSHPPSNSYSQPQWQNMPLPQPQPPINHFQSPSPQTYSNQHNSQHNSWNANPGYAASLPQNSLITSPVHSTTPKIEIGQKLSNSIYANRKFVNTKRQFSKLTNRSLLFPPGDSLRYDLSSISNNDKNPFSKQNFVPSPPSVNPFNPSMQNSLPISNQFKPDISHQAQALLSDPSFYNRMSQLMPYLNGRFGPDLSQEQNKQTPIKSNTNEENMNYDKSSDFKPMLNNTRDEYGFFKRHDSHRFLPMASTSTTTTTTSTTVAPNIRRFI